jgi:hypothetical protein
VSLRTSFTLAFFAAALAGCVAQDGFPSLALRPAENEVLAEDPVHPAVEVASDAALRGRISELQRQAAEGNRAFDATLGAAEAAVSAAGPAQSDSWIEAQQMLSRLENTRAPTTRALSDLDQLAIQRAAEPTNSEDFATLDAAINSVEQITAGQQQRMDRLRARLGGP